MYHGALVAMRRHLARSTCSFLIWERAADLQTGHAYSIIGRMSCLYSTVPDGETASPIQEGSQRSHPLCRFLSCLIDVFRPGEAFIKGHPQDNGSHRPIRLAPRRALLLGVSGCAYRSWRKAWRRTSRH